MKNPLRKIIFSIIIMLVGLLYVQADECPMVINEETTNSRTITCNSQEPTLTTFSYPTAGTREVFKNDMCSIRCKEEVLYLIDSAKSIRAGMGFTFPLYVSGQRTCTATYNYEDYDKKLRDLITSRNDASSAAARLAVRNEISNHLLMKEDCDTWKDNSGKYTMNPNINLRVQTSGADETISYEFKESSPYSSVVMDVKEPGEFCSVPNNNSDCTPVNEAISEWTEIARIDGSFVMTNRFIELYTGRIVNVRSNNTCSAGDVYFSSFTEKTYPASGSRTDLGYRLDLTARNLGQNLVPGNKNWRLNVNCWYSLVNYIFPQGEDGGGSNNDENYDRFGSTAFMYRPIDLNNPFPNRSPGYNWVGKESLITGNVSSLGSKTAYDIRLSPQSIRTIRNYNRTNPYDTFNLNNKQQSAFINQFSKIVIRK